MSALIVAVLLAARVPGPLSGHSIKSVLETPSARDTEAQVLLRLEDDWAAGLIRRDIALFQRLLADGFVYTEDDRTVGREAVLHDISAGTDTVQTAHNEEMNVHRFGTTAVVTGWLVIGGRGSSGPFNRRYRFTDTWLRRAGRWQIVAAHDYLVPRRWDRAAPGAFWSRSPSHSKASTISRS